MSCIAFMNTTPTTMSSASCKCFVWHVMNGSIDLLEVFINNKDALLMLMIATYNVHIGKEFVV